MSKTLNTLSDLELLALAKCVDLNVCNSFTLERVQKFYLK